MTSSDIIRVLAAKHAADVFVPECKTGMSGEGMQRMDAWVMAKSWAHPLVTAYEVKVSRSDFLKDDKWHGYLPYCNSFYFACPKDLIKAEELPKEVGLIWISKNATMCYTKRKAVYRDVKIPEDVFRYVLMCRANISREQAQTGDKHYWAQWLENKKMDYDFGWRVSKTIRQTIEDKITSVEKKNKEMEYLVDKYRSVQALLNNLGFDECDIHSYSLHDRLTRKLEEIKLGVGQDLIDYLNQVKQSITKAVDVLNRPMVKESADDNRTV